MDDDTAAPMTGLSRVDAGPGAGPANGVGAGPAAGPAMVTTPHRLASEAGAKILRAGGNAIEAIVAAGAALSVVYPHFCGLGGDAVWIVCDRDGTATTFLGIGQAPDILPKRDAIPVRGPGSILTSAGLVDSWHRVLDHGRANWAGTATLSTLLGDAIELAEAGYAVGASQAFWHGFRKAEVETWPGFSAIFRSDGLQRQPDLARTLRRIADNGTRDFYEGDLAATIAAGLAELGAPVSARDLARTRTRREAPLRIDYRDHTLLAPPPPTQGATTLAIMGILGRLASASPPPESAAFYHRLVESVKQAFLDRGAIADPAFGASSGATFLDPDRLAAKALAIDPERALPWPHRAASAETAYLGAVDGQGRCVSMLQSTYFDWGSGCVVPGTGILWQNRGAAFSLDPTSPNRIEPGKLPFYTLNPGLALKAGRPRLLYGTQGADGQPQTLALLLSLVIDHGLDPVSALSRPRFLLGRTFSDGRDTLKIEETVGADVVAALEAMGHEVRTIEGLSQLGGQAGILRIGEDGRLDGAHDPRSDGAAIGVGP